MTIRVGDRVRIVLSDSGPIAGSIFVGMVGTVVRIQGDVLPYEVQLDEYPKQGPIPFHRDELVYTS